MAGPSAVVRRICHACRGLTEQFPLPRIGWLNRVGSERRCAVAGRHCDGGGLARYELCASGVGTSDDRAGGEVDLEAVQTGPSPPSPPPRPQGPAELRGTVRER
jgi:hypothetical protein